ncbi:MAG TPA: BTAD domain-containing putative transcriptional regulator [Candidatus Limnocylindrales bacterium]|nr:BTAD domain-containing putative transcriptional regulator [Candidatus Limnocylindrales bacterium]
MTDTGAGVVATKVRVPDVPSMGLDRLDARLDAVWGHRLGLVVAPAGSGKTSLLARFAGRAAGPVGWYRAEGWDSDEPALVRHLEAALAPTLPGTDRGWKTVADAANALAAWQGPQVLLVVDDLHTIDGTAAEAALERLIEYAPETLTIVAATRRPPRFNLSRLRVSGQLVELTGDDLRFRSWEVERLFRDFYEEPLPPEDLARLARRTEGWAAGLQLFHLATRGRPADERRRLLSELGGSSRLARELRDYLARNVLDQLPADLRRFLVETSVLGRLNGELCDRLLGRTDSRDVLDDLERRRLFTHRLAEEGWYRYHEVLRSHLQAVLLEEVGASGLRDRFCTAGGLLVESGAMPEAVEAFCRGEDWDRVSAMLGRNGRAVADEPSAWLDALPAAIVSNDPWLLLANARRLRSEGRIDEATDAYRRAEVVFGPSEAGSMCRLERQAILHWGAEGGTPTDRRDPSALLRIALGRDPLAVVAEAERLGTPEGEVVAGLAALAAGHVGRSRRDLLHAAERSEAGRLAQLVSALGAGVAGLLMGQRHAAVEIDGAVAAAEEAGIEWLARMGRALLAVGGSAEAVSEAEAVAEASRRLGDHWGQALAGLAAAWGATVAGRSHHDLDALVETARGLEAGTLEAWARGLEAVAAARDGDPEAREAAAIAEAAARAVGVPAASLLANLAFAAVTASGEAEEYGAMAESIRRDTGLLAPPAHVAPAISTSNGRDSGHRQTYKLAARPGTNGASQQPPLEIRVLGGFELRRAGAPVDLSSARPRARALLRLLCLNAGTAVHHETIEAAMWPDADQEASSRNLHVAMASLRRVLEPNAARGTFQVLRREGGAYRLALPDGAVVDLIELERELAAGRAAADRGDGGAAAALLQAALDRYAGDLLPEDGPAEWVADRREAVRHAVAEAAHRLAGLLLGQDDAEGAARAATAGLRIDRYHDPLWRTLIRARDAAGDQGAASRARTGYDRMLAELGVDTRIATEASAATGVS